MQNKAFINFYFINSTFQIPVLKPSNSPLAILEGWFLCFIIKHPEFSSFSLHLRGVKWQAENLSLLFDWVIIIMQSFCSDTLHVCVLLIKKINLLITPEAASSSFPICSIWAFTWCYVIIHTNLHIKIICYWCCRKYFVTSFAAVNIIFLVINFTSAFICPEQDAHEKLVVVRVIINGFLFVLVGVVLCSCIIKVQLCTYGIMSFILLF